MIIIYKDVSLENYTPKDNLARQNLEYMNKEERSLLNTYFESIYPKGISNVEIDNALANDYSILNYIAKAFGYYDFNKLKEGRLNV